MFSSFRKSWLNKLTRSLFGRTRPIQNRPLEASKQSKLKVELLEDRVVPPNSTAALHASNNLNITMLTLADVGNITMTLAGGPYNFADAGRQFTPGGANSGNIDASNPNSINILAANLNSIYVTYGSGAASVFAIGATSGSVVPM